MSQFRRVPWWVYAVVIGGLNVVRQIVFPPSQVGAAVTVGLFFAVLMISFAVIATLAALTEPRSRE